MTSENGAPKRAATYVRISKDDEGKEGAGLGVQRQAKECRDLAARLGGMTITKVYSDNDISAYGGKRRPGYLELLSDIKAGEVDVVLCWHTDRLHRSMAELEGYIDACEPRKVATQTVKGGDVDLTTSNGRMIARIFAAIAAGEVEHMIERIKSAHEQKRERGEWHGGPVPYGYRKEPTGEIRKGRVVNRLVIEDSEADIIREIAASALAGKSLRGICRDLNDRGVPSPSEARPYKYPPAIYAKGGWQVANVRALLLKPFNAGLIAFDADWKQDGQRRARPSWECPIIGPGNWEPIISREMSGRLRDMLTDPARRTWKPGPRYRYLLSGIARCGVCGSRDMRAGGGSARTQYVCQNGGHVGRAAHDVDRLVNHAVIKRLSKPGFAGSLNPPVDIAALDARRAGLRSRLNNLAARCGAGEIDDEQLVVASRPLKAEIAEIGKEISAAYQDSAFDGIAGAADPAAAYLNAGIDKQRRLVDALLEVTILPVEYGPPASPAERRRRFRERQLAGAGAVKRGPAFRKESVQIRERQQEPAG